MKEFVRFIKSNSHWSIHSDSLQYHMYASEQKRDQFWTLQLENLVRENQFLHPQQQLKWKIAQKFLKSAGAV